MSSSREYKLSDFFFLFWFYFFSIYSGRYFKLEENKRHIIALFLVAEHLIYNLELEQ